MFVFEIATHRPTYYMTEESLWVYFYVEVEFHSHEIYVADGLVMFGLDIDEKEKYFHSTVSYTNHFILLFYFG